MCRYCTANCHSAKLLVTFPFLCYRYVLKARWAIILPDHGVQPIQAVEKLELVALVEKRDVTDGRGGYTYIHTASPSRYIPSTQLFSS